MTLGEKLSKLRKEYNYTQEQLADILGVSRQSISKWESDIAYPETDKLIKMGKLFECSMDYLLNDDITEKQGIEPKETETFWDNFKKQFHVPSCSACVGFSGGTTGSSGSLLCGAREVRSRCVWRGGARHCSRVMVGESGL